MLALDDGAGHCGGSIAREPPCSEYAWYDSAPSTAPSGPAASEPLSTPPSKAGWKSQKTAACSLRPAGSPAARYAVTCAATSAAYAA